MPELHNPGVYVQETSATMTIVALPTSRTAFLGSAIHGPVGEPVIINGMDGFRSTFGGPGGTLHPAVELFFINGGTEAVVVRLHLSNASPNGTAPKVPDLVPGGNLAGRGKVTAGAKIRAGRTIGEPFLDAACFTGSDGGIRALDGVTFDLLYIPPYGEAGDVGMGVLAAAASYCGERRAMLLIDAPKGWSDPDSAERSIGNLGNALGSHARNAALYFPWLRRKDGSGNIEDVPPGAAVAGIIARTDAQRGTWKAPAGTEAQVRGVEGTTIAIDDGDLDRLNPLAINCLRPIPGLGTAVWGARTLETADPEWKYVPIRRLSLHMEKSLQQGLRWTAFEPNEQALWSKVRSCTDAFLLGLFRQGAFQGTAPRDAFFVRCGSETTARADIERGMLNLEVGFAPLRPAEFVLIRLQLRAGGSG
jgi:phage tail sheath protein FI